MAGEPKNDEFEARYMTAGERVLHRDKSVTRGIAALLGASGLFTLGLAVFVAVINGTSDKPLPPVALPAVVAAIGVLGVGLLVLAATMAVMRVVVTDRALHIKYGLWGPTIALGSIRKVRVVDYDWTMYGGWGLRRGRDGSWAYVARNGPVAEVTYQDGGVEKRVLVGAEAAHELCDRLRRACGLDATSPPLRIAATTGADDAEAEAEAAAAAEPEAPRRARR